MCLLTRVMWNTLGKFAEIGQARYVITAFVVIEENWDHLENYSFCWVCVEAERKNTGELGEFERVEQFEDTTPLFKIGFFPTTRSSWTAKRGSGHEQNQIKELLCRFFLPPLWAEHDLLKIQTCTDRIVWSKTKHPEMQEWNKSMNNSELQHPSSISVWIPGFIPLSSNQ